jgi:hypothetical protein
MSWQASAWAVEQQEVTHHVTRHVLLCLANYANADGRSAFPALLRLSRDTGLSERAIRSHLRELEKHALIRRGKPEVVAAHISRPDRRPICYDLLIPRGAQHSPRGSTGGTAEPNGGHMTTERGARHAPDPPLSSINSKRSDALQSGEAEKSRKVLRDLVSGLKGSLKQ